MASSPATAAIQAVPLAQLVLAPENVRATPPTKVDQAELMASIRSHGLLENLIARRDDPAPDGSERFAVIAGGRRLSVLETLAANGDIPADHPVPCLVVSNDNSVELSLAENTVRTPMHPADQVVAFNALIEAGATVAQVAARFGVSQRLVKQRARLGGIAPEIMQAFREERLDLEALKAFSVTTDHERQMSAWKHFSERSWAPYDYEVRRMLTDDRIPSGAAVARFVGVNAYKASGGTFLRDLFSNDSNTWLDNTVLLHELAMKKLEAKAAEIAEHWAWTAAMVEVDWETEASFGRVRPVRGAPTDEEEAEADRCRNRMSELAEVAGDDWTDEHAAELSGLRESLAAIDAAVSARDAFSDEDRAIAGCIVTVGRDGGIRLIEGLVRPDDMPEPEADAATGNDGDAKEPSGADRYRPPPAGPADPRTEARRKAGIGIGLADDLRAIRTAVVKKHLQQDFDAAFDLLLFQMARAILGGDAGTTYGYLPSAIDVSFKKTSDRPALRVNDPAFAGWNPAMAVLEDLSGQPLDWLAETDDDARFSALCALPREDKERLFAACVARTLKGQLAFEHDVRPEFEATAARLDIDFAGEVRPGADMFWSRIPKSSIVDIANDILGAEWVHSHSKYKKAELAEAAETAFAPGEPPPGVSPEAHAAALSWTPPGFAPHGDAKAAPAVESGEESAGEAPASSAADAGPDGLEPSAADDPVPEPEVPEYLRNAA